MSERSADKRPNYPTPPTSGSRRSQRTPDGREVPADSTRTSRSPRTAARQRSASPRRRSSYGKAETRQVAHVGNEGSALRNYDRAMDRTLDRTENRKTSSKGSVHETDIPSLSKQTESSNFHFDSEQRDSALGPIRIRRPSKFSDGPGEMTTEMEASPKVASVQDRPQAARAGSSLLERLNMHTQSADASPAAAQPSLHDGAALARKKGTNEVDIPDTVDGEGGHATYGQAEEGFYRRGRGRGRGRANRAQGRGRGRVVAAPY